MLTPPLIPVPLAIRDAPELETGCPGLAGLAA